MAVTVTPTAQNPATRRALVRIVCNVCGHQLHVTSQDDCRLRFMTTRLAIAHESRCVGR